MAFTLPGPTTPAAVGQVVERIKSEVTTPFRTPLDPWTFSLIVCLGLTVAYLWSRVLRHFVE